MRTQALVVEKPGANFTMQDVELDDDDIRDDEVRVRIKATGVCHTDIGFSAEESMPELYPAVLGHEGAGVVERTGSQVTLVEPGDHVVVTYTSCGTCKYCTRKETSYCDLWFKYNFGVGRLDGSKAFRSVGASGRSSKEITSHFFGQSSFAKHILVKETGLVKMPRDIPFDRLAPLGCGFMTGAGAMLNVVKPTHDMSVAVVGVGSVGLAAIMALKMLERPPRKIIAIDVVPSRLELARKYGATHGVNSKLRGNLMEVMMDITDGRGVDGAIDTTGRPGVVQDLIHSAARKGIVVSVGVGELSAEASMCIFEMVNSGCRYVGCCEGNCYPPDFLPQLLEANRQGKFPYEQLLRTYPARDIGKAIDDTLNGRAVKAVLQWD